MKKSKKIILTLSAVTLTAGVLFTGIGYMNGGRFGFAFSDGKFISADSIEEEKQPFILEKKKLAGIYLLLFSINPQNIIVFITILNATIVKARLQFFYIVIRVINRGNF